MRQPVLNQGPARTTSKFRGPWRRWDRRRCPCRGGMHHPWTRERNSSPTICATRWRSPSCATSTSRTLDALRCEHRDRRRLDRVRRRGHQLHEVYPTVAPTEALDRPPRRVRWQADRLRQAKSCHSQLRAHAADRAPGRFVSLRLAPVAAGSLPFVLSLRFRNGLPLHVARPVGTATFQRDDMVNDVAWPAVRIAGLAHEFALRCFAADKPSVAVPRSHISRPVVRGPVRRAAGVATALDVAGMPT